MKKVLFFALSLIASVTMYSCGGDDSEPTPPPGPDPTYKLDVNKSSLNFDSTNAPAQTIIVTSENVKWTLQVEESATSWLSVEEDGNTITVTVTDNTEETARSGHFSVTPDTDKVPAKTITVTQVASEIIDPLPSEIVMTTGLLQFYGNDYDPAIGHCTIYLGSEGTNVVTDETGASIEIIDGYFITLELLMGTPFGKEEYENPELIEGTYNVSTKFFSTSKEYEPMTFLKGIISSGLYYGSILSLVENDRIRKQYLFWSGTVDIAKGTGNSYDITMNIVLADGEEVKITFNKEFDHTSYQPNSASSYKEDQTVNNFSQGNIIYYAEEYGETPWQIQAATPEVIIENNILKGGSGFILTLEMYSPATGERILPDATYELFDVRSSGKAPTYNCIAGMIYNNMFAGSWLREIEEGNNKYKNIGAIYYGTITTKHNGGANYTIEIDCLFDNYNSYKASFTMDLPVYDTTTETKASAFPALSRRTSVNNIKPAYLQ